MRNEKLEQLMEGWSEEAKEVVRGSKLYEVVRE